VRLCAGGAYKNNLKKGVIVLPAPALTKSAILHAFAAAKDAGRPVAVVTMQPNESPRVDFFLPDPAGVANANPFPR
jgi:hypothetical protein